MCPFFMCFGLFMVHVCLSSPSSICLPSVFLPTPFIAAFLSFFLASLLPSFLTNPCFPISLFPHLLAPSPPRFLASSCPPTSLPCPLAFLPHRLRAPSPSHLLAPSPLCPLSSSPLSSPRFLAPLLPCLLTSSPPHLLAFSLYWSHPLLFPLTNSTLPYLPLSVSFSLPFFHISFPDVVFLP